MGSNLMLAKKLIGIDWSGASQMLGSHDLDVECKVYGVLHIFGLDVWITQTVVTTWVFMAILLIALLIIRAKLGNMENEKPSGLQNVMELIVESITNFVITAMGENHTGFVKWFFGVFTFVLISNISGLLCFRPPTADLCTTLGLALVTFAMIHFMGIKTGKGSYFKSFLEPVPFLLPLNIISELAKPVSLSFRLFGNILGGMIIMGLLYALVPIWLRFGIPGVLHMYFDLFAGCIQTVIFCMLSMIFISDKIAE